MSIVVVGSLNIDYLASVETLPGPGETVPARSMVQRFGGKGANQAVAAARQGVRVHFIGSVGNDDAGRAYRARLHKEGIRTGGIGIACKAPTGMALIAVDRGGENMIVVAAGANGLLRLAAVRAQAQRIREAKAVLLQFECPLPAVAEAVRIANRAHVPVVLNPSPFREGFPWTRCRVDCLVINEGEAKAAFGMHPDTLKTKPAAWRQAMSEKNVGRLVITRGAGSTLLLDENRLLEVPTLKVSPVDTVGAGDSFTGTLAARLARGVDLWQAILNANCAGALATLKAGAQESIPSRAATERAVARLLR